MDKASDAGTSTRAPRRDKNKDNPNEPSVIGSYKIDRTLGQGTYGKVKLGIHQSTNEKVAIKIIEKANIQSQRQVARIQREIRFLKLLHHPHIVKVYEVHETTEQIFIVMEFVQGGELFDYIVSHKRVKEKEARAFYRMMLSALHYCHANAVIHRDLKPENLLLDTDKTIKIIDFGFGNTFKPHGLLETFCGSPFYAAPEMILGKKYEGPEVDMWSVGVILFALLCGHLPFDDENIKELYKKIAAGTFTCPPYLSAPAKHLITRLITVDPRKRATLDEVLNHQWVNEGFSRPPHSFLPERPVIRDPTTLSADIVHRLNAFGYTADDIEKSFLEEDHSKPNPIRATYFLLSEMLAREEKKLRDAKKNSSASSSSAAAAAAAAAASLATAQTSTSETSLTSSNSSAVPKPTSNSAATVVAPAPVVATGVPTPAPPIIMTSEAEDRQGSTGSNNTVNSSATAVVAATESSSSGSASSDQQHLPNPTAVNAAAPSVTCSLYSISEDEDGTHRNAAAAAAAAAAVAGGPRPSAQPSPGQLGITAAGKNTFVSMPLPQVSDKSRRASTPDAEPQPLPTVRVPERPRHSTTSLATSGPRSAPGVAASALALNTQGPPSPGSTPGPQSAGTQIMHRPATSAAGTVVDKQTLAVGTTGPQAGDKGRRFSLAVLTSGSKRRSSTSPPTAPVAGTVPVHLPSVLPMVQDPSNSDEGSSGSTSPSGTLTVAEVHSSASASSSESSNADARTVSSWFLNVNTTSSKPPAEIIAEVKRVLTECHVQYAHDAGFVVECRLADLVFEIEICKVPRLALFGLHFKRISGGIWTYKKLCNKLLSQMSL